MEWFKGPPALEWSREMGTRLRCFVVPFVAVWLAAPVRGQESIPAEQPSSETFSAVEPCNTCACSHSLYFEADWLWTSHAGMWSSTRNFIDGPDAAGFDNLSAFSGDNGYRLRGGIRLNNWIFEGVYSHFGAWDSWLEKNVNGVAFNASAAAGNWAGQNVIGTNTYFAPIYNAASLTVPVNTAGDQSGLGPSAAFPADALPALMAHAHSEFYMTEANVKGAEYVLPVFGHGIRLGLGYVNANLNEDSWVAMSGTFRAFNGGGPTLSLPNAALTAPAGGNLSLFSGGGSGFSDGTNNVTGIPSQLLFTHQASTSNQFNGAQMLMDCDLLEFDRLQFGMTLKAGIFDNFAQGAVVETYRATNNDLSAYGRQFTDSHHQLAFLGGIGVDAGYHVTDEITISAGYEVLFLTNLALAQEQLIGINAGMYHVQTNGSALIQSVRMGLEIAF
jgi:hypothetical protein